MTKLRPLALASALLAGCAADSTGAPPAAEAPEGPSPASAHAPVGSFVMKVQPRQGRVDLYRLPAGVTSRDALLSSEVSPEALDNLTIVATSGAPPANMINLVTDQSSIVDTYGTGESGGCPASSFCANVALSHTFAGLDLSAVYVQVYALTDTNRVALAGHGPTNGVGSTPFGIDLTLGAWQYTPAMGTIAEGASATQTWSFANPDDATTYIFLDTLAALYPMLWFGTGAITQTAPLVPGQPASIHYVYGRNTACRGSGWSMQGYLKGYNIDIHTTSWPGASTATFFDQYVIMPFGAGVDLWFNNTDGSGCNSYDSNGGSNFNYAIGSGYPAIYFAGPSAAQDPYYTPNSSYGAETGVGAGATITVDYELDRVVCGGLDQYGRVPSGVTATMHYQLDGGAFAGVSLLGLPYDVPASINGDAAQVYVPPVISIPSGSHQLVAYFDSTAPSGCHNYDSNFSANYIFNY